MINEWVWSTGRMILAVEKQNTRRRIRLYATMSTVNPTRVACDRILTCVLGGFRLTTRYMTHPRRIFPLGWSGLSMQQTAHLDPLSTLRSSGFVWTPMHATSCHTEGLLYLLLWHTRPAELSFSIEIDNKAWYLQMDQTRHVVTAWRRYGMRRY
jgi:hypothetical protein